MAIKHDAFISYSHHADQALAKALEDGMERLAKPLLSLRAIDVFRDETALSANPDLWATIVDHLSGSEWLIVLACPEWVGSAWCSREAQWWIENRSTDRMLIAIVSGDVAWDGAHADFDWAASTALNRCLSGRFREEPLYVDLRWTRGAEGLTLTNLQFRDAVLSLSATVRGIAKDKLDGDDVRQLRRNRRLVRAGVTAITIAGAVAVWQAIVAIEERNTARSRELAAQSQLQLADAEASPRLPALLALESLRVEENAVAHDALQTSLSRLAPPHVGTVVVGLQRTASKTAFSPDSRYLAVLTEGQFAGEPMRVELWQVAEGRQVAAWDVTANDMTPSFSDDGGYLAFAADEKTTAIVAVETHSLVRKVAVLSQSWAWTGGGLRLLVAGAQPNVVRVVDGIADRELASITAQAAIVQAAISPDGRLVATTTAEPQLAVWRIADTGASGAWQKATRADDPVFSADGRKLAAIVDDKTAAVFDTDTGEIAERMAASGKVLGVRFSPAAQYVLVAEEPGRIRVWDLMLHKPIVTVGGRTNEFTTNDMIDVTQRSPIIDVGFVRDDSLFITVRSDGVVTAWKRGATAGFGTFGVNFFDHAEALRVSAGQNLKQAVISPDGRHLMTSAGGNAMNATGTMEIADYKTRLWDMADGREIGRITSERPITVVAVGPNGQLVATQSAVASIAAGDRSAKPSFELHAWRLTDTIGAGEEFLPGPSGDALKEIPYGILSLDGRHAAGMTEAGLMLWDAAHGVRKLDLPEQDGADARHDRSSTWRALQFSDDGGTLMLAAGRSVFAFRTGDGGLIGRKDLGGDIESHLVVDRQGRTAAATVFHPDKVTAPPKIGGAFPRGALETRVWKIADGADVATIEHATATMVIGLARDAGVAALTATSVDPKDMEALGKNLRVSVPIKTSLVLWDISSGRALMPPIASDDSIGSATFSDDGKTMMTTNLPVAWVMPGPIAVGAGSFAIWDVHTGRQLEKPRLAMPKSLADMVPHGPPLAADAFLAAFGFGQDGHSVVVTEPLMEAADRTRIRTRRIIWQTGDLTRQVCERLPADQRALTADEVRRYVPGESYRPACAPVTAR